MQRRGTQIEVSLLILATLEAVYALISIYIKVYFELLSVSRASQGKLAEVFCVLPETGWRETLSVVCLRGNAVGKKWTRQYEIRVSEGLFHKYKIGNKVCKDDDRKMFSDKRLWCMSKQMIIIHNKYTHLEVYMFLFLLYITGFVLYGCWCFRLLFFLSGTGKQNNLDFAATYLFTKSPVWDLPSTTCRYCLLQSSSTTVTTKLLPDLH